MRLSGPIFPIADGSEVHYSRPPVESAPQHPDFQPPEALPGRGQTHVDASAPDDRDFVCCGLKALGPARGLDRAEGSDGISVLCSP